MKKQRISLAIGIVASIIFLLCVALVTISLHLTPQMDQFASKSQDYYCINFSLLGFAVLRFHVVEYSGQTQSLSRGARLVIKSCSVGLKAYIKYDEKTIHNINNVQRWYRIAF